MCVVCMETGRAGFADSLSLRCCCGGAAIDTDAGLLCQSRDQQAWNGARSAKGVTGKGLLTLTYLLTDRFLSAAIFATVCLAGRASGL